MRCTQCEAEVVDEAIYCHQCGNQLAGIDFRPSPRDMLRLPQGTASDDTPEEELWQGGFSKQAMIGSWLAAATFTLVMFLVAALGSFSGKGWLFSLGLIVLVWLGLVAQLFYRQLSVRYYLTNQRFVHENGLLWREINRIEAIDIDDVSFQQGPIERMVGVGSIQVRSSDQSHPLLELLGIENVSKVAAMIDEVRRQERLKRGLHVEAV